jgi:hypothetical protein
MFYAGDLASVIIGIIFIILLIVFIAVFSTVSINCKKCFNPPLPIPINPCLNYFYQQVQSPLIGVGGIGPNTYQGASVDISSNGNTIVSGSPGDNSGIGCGYVFVKQNGFYNQFGPKLVGTGSIGTSQQGYIVAISGDGSTIAISGIEDNSYIGAIWIFVLSLSTFEYVQQGSKLVASDYIGLTPYQGSSVSKIFHI